MSLKKNKKFSDNPWAPWKKSDTVSIIVQVSKNKRHLAVERGQNLSSLPSYFLQAAVFCVVLFYTFLKSISS